MAGLPWFKQQVDLRRDPRSLILGDMLGDPRAWTYVVEMRMYFAENAPTGCVSGLHADVAFERGSGWTGERGRLLNALREAGFVRAAPAREGGGMEIEDLDWVREQGAHVAKFQRDAKKPDGRAHKVVNPSRDTGGSRAAPAELPSGESRELRVESREERSSASQEPESVPERPELVLEAQKPGRPPRKQSAAEKLFANLQALRVARCEEMNERATPERWEVALINKVLGPLTRAPPEEQQAFEAGWMHFLADESRKELAPAWALRYFMKNGVREMYETRAAREDAA